MPRLRALLPTLALAAVVMATTAVPATASPSAKAVATPTISSIAPMTVRVTGTLTIRGRNFRSGTGKNTVVFQRQGGPAIFVRAGTATTTRIRVTLPVKLMAYLARRSNQAVATRMRVRVLARRFGRAFTPTSKSPMIQPVDGIGPGGEPVNPKPPFPSPDCDLDRIPDTTDTDDDNDYLRDTREFELGLLPCVPDSDRDGMEDGWEYESALDVNSRALPYPGKRPYPNPLFADAGADHDNDGLLAGEEHAAWVRWGQRAMPITYSEGDQTSGPSVFPGVGQGYLDLNGNGQLSDDEKDVDGDGLGNYDEIRGRFDPRNSPDPDKYPLDWLDTDTDGDKLADGPDDQDHDGFSNIEEISTGVDGILSDPWLPCNPDPLAPFCELHPPSAAASRIPRAARSRSRAASGSRTSGPDCRP